jgi:transposase
MDEKRVNLHRNWFSDAEQRSAIEEYLRSGLSKNEFWTRYMGKTDHGVLTRWMRRLGYLRPEMRLRAKLALNEPVMGKKSKPADSPSQDTEALQLKRRIAELERQLKDAELKAIAFSTMVDIAEKEFKIPIRKKFNTKPSDK